MRRSLKIIVFTFVVSICAIASWNYVVVQRPASQLISGDSRNSGIAVIAHFQWFVNPRVIVFDLRKISGEKSQLDISRILLQIADKLKDKKFHKIILAHKGKEKFFLKGDYFNKIGTEYIFQNSFYTLRKLPENVCLLDGSPAFSTWSGGLLGVVGKQMDDLNEFHERWYISDIIGGG